MMADATCTSCATALHESAKFCHECGLSTAADPAEYKQVTILFADVVRSMDIAAAVDVERLREIMTELVEQSAAVVQRYGGGSVDYTGDGLMAVFGAPVALEDHAFRACLAALDIQKEAEVLATAVARRDGVALQLRVGLNSGRVIAGELGTGWMGYTATGAAVGFAERMESVAPPGGVMLSESTARLVEQEAVLGEPQWVRIKGAHEPVKVCRLLAIGPRGGQGRRTDSTLVGTDMGDGGPRCDGGPRDRWPRRSRECGGTAGYRQEPSGPRGRGARRPSRRRGVLGGVRIPRR
jgi:class 3 adenylate cyclase